MHALDLKPDSHVQPQRARVVAPDDERHPRARPLNERIVEQRRQNAPPAPLRMRRRKRQFAVEAPPPVVHRTADKLAAFVCDADGRARAEFFRRERDGQQRGYELRNSVVLIEDKR